MEGELCPNMQKMAGVLFKNRQVWKADEATILSWRNNKYYVPVKQKSSTDSIGLLKAKPPRG